MWVDVAGGQLQVAIGSYQSFATVQPRGVKAIGVTGSYRSPKLPDVPTLAEAGIPGYEVVVWYALFAPAKTPLPILARLNSETVKALNTPELKDRLTLQGLDVASSTPDALQAFVISETAKWTKVARAAGVQLE